MQYIKLQLGCLVIVAFVISRYIKDLREAKIENSKWFGWITIFVPWAIVFDGITAWTVNHPMIIPFRINMTLHFLFFILMDCVLLFSFLYMLDLTGGIPEKPVMRLVMCLPAIVSTAAIVMTMNSVYFVEGSFTNYSMGIPVYACYISMLIHFGMIFGLLYVKRRNISKRKMEGLITVMCVCTLTLLVQAIFPQALISALLPTLLVIVLYVYFENPALKTLKHYNQEVVMGFATLVENRDHSTGGHIKRTRDYVSIILDAMKVDLRYRDVITRDYIDDVLSAAPMHDIGKISTPDYILQKQGKLTDDEYDIMKKHSEKGAEIINETFADFNDPQLQKITYEVARYHHEKWNGRGYPDGLKETEIPLHARIMAIADVFDAVSANRCYRAAMPLDKCFRIIEEGSGSDFDPDLVELFMSRKEQVIAFHDAPLTEDDTLTEKEVLSQQLKLSGA